jgi:hypothetical protein
VIGGVDDDGPVATVERFRSAAGDFEILGDDHFGTGSGGFIGASLTAVGNRAIAVGGPVTAWQAWELDGTSAGPQFLPEARAFHAAVAIDSNRVLLAGGCSQVVTGSQSCAPGSALRTTSVLDIDSGEIERGPRLLSDRIGGTAYVDVDGTVILVGGTDLDGSAIASGERLELGADEGVAIANLSGASSGQMLSGSVVVGYGQGAAPSGEIRTVGAGATEGVAQLSADARGDATMTATEDGQILVVGGGAGLARFRPFAATVAPVASDAGGTRSRHAATRLADGSVLVVGGRNQSAEARSDAWLIRPPLLGPLENNDISARFGDFEAAGAWVPSDPELLVRVDGATAYGQLRSTGSFDDDGLVPRSYALVAGPLFREVSATAIVSSDEGVALLFGHSIDRSWVVGLRPGQQARLLDRQGPSSAELGDCSVREVVADGDVGAGGEPVVLTARVSDSSIEVRSGERLLLRCEPGGAPPRGSVGLGALGAADSLLRIDALSVSRRVR